MYDSIKKYNSIEKLYIGIWAFYSAEYVLFSSSTLSQYTFAGRLHGICSVGTLAMLFFLFLLVNKISRRRLFWGVLFMGLIFLITISTQGINIIIGILFALIAQNIDVKKLILFDVKLKLVLLFTILALCGLGIVENKVGYAAGIYKQSLGFINQNVFTAFSFVILLEWLYVHCGKVKRYQYIIILILMYIISYISKARTTLYTFILILALYFLANSKPWIFYGYVSKIIFAIITPILAIFCFIGCYLYMQGNAFIIAIDKIMSYRILYASYALSKYGVNLIGFKINEQGIAIDIGYVYCAIRFGLIYLILICLIYSVQFIRFLKCKKIDIALFMLFFVLIGIGEGYMYNVIFNTSMLYLLHSNKRIQSLN